MVRYFKSGSSYRFNVKDLGGFCVHKRSALMSLFGSTALSSGLSSTMAFISWWISITAQVSTTTFTFACPFLLLTKQPSTVAPLSTFYCLSASLVHDLTALTSFTLTCNFNHYFPLLSFNSSSIYMTLSLHFYYVTGNCSEDYNDLTFISA